MASRTYSSIEVKVGIFVAFCLALFVAMLMSYGRLAPIWRGRTELRVVFANIAGLSTDAPVRYNGVEMGRVKWMRLLHLDKDNLKRLPPLARRDLDNLPLWPDALVKELREVSEIDFDSRCRKALQNRTMIELCLEVLQEGDLKRYHMNDTVRITSTVFGDCAVEIISGTGAINEADSDKLIIGSAGDFFSNLAKSMGDVKEILGGVTDVVGAQERRSFERASARLSNITARTDKMAKLADERSDITAKRIDALSSHISKTLNNANETFDGISPLARRSFDSMKANMKKAEDQISAAQADASAAFKGISTDFKLVRDDAKSVVDQTKPHFEPMRQSFRDVYDRFGNLSVRIDSMREIAGDVMIQSEPDIQRMMDALHNSLYNLKCAGQAANENKDLMISNRDQGEYEYATALDIYRKITMATRRICAAGAEVQEVEQLLKNRPIDVSTNPAAGAAGPSPIFTNAESTVGKLSKVRVPLEQVRDTIEEKMLPNFERKKHSWKDEAPPLK